MYGTGSSDVFYLKTSGSAPVTPPEDGEYAPIFDNTPSDRTEQDQGPWTFRSECLTFLKGFLVDKSIGRCTCIYLLVSYIMFAVCETHFCSN